MSESIFLPISTGYVSHWGFWEATRELLQNAIDTGSESISEMRSNGFLTISSSGGALDLSSLALGESSKRDNSSSIGKYGEGYKLALLVLCRLGKPVLIKNGLDCWKVGIAEHPQLGVECLAVDVYKDTYADESDHENSVTFIVGDISIDEFDTIKDNYLSKCIIDDLKIIAEHNGSFAFLSGDCISKKVYVGGLFVCNLDDAYHYSYNFAPNILELDRDRNSVSGFYLEKEATSLFSDSGNVELLIDMASSGAKDISDYYSIKESRSYYSGSNSTGYEKNTVDMAVKSFLIKNGSKAYPIRENGSNNKVIREQCVSLGMVPVTVKEMLFDIIKSEFEYKLKITKLKGKISDSLAGFLKLNRNKMEPIARKRLSELIKSIQLKGE
tara:strand:+ start:19552 stop:20706 length:1155 start_codon:yes stop_codon:yes gene_type:complete